MRYRRKTYEVKAKQITAGHLDQSEDLWFNGCFISNSIRPTLFYENRIVALPIRESNWVVFLPDTHRPLVLSDKEFRGLYEEIE